MKKRVVESREYKIMLKAEKFHGDEQTVLQAAGDFWDAFKARIADVVIDADGSLRTIKKRRRIQFFDTETCRLRRNDYVFRERVDIESDEREVTLKFRHPDRYVAQDRGMEGKSKFEEDIKAPLQSSIPFVSLYSLSGKQEISATKKLNKMKDPRELFPALQGELDHYDEDETITRVGDFTAHEFVVTGADFQINKAPKLEAECALIVWCDEAGARDQPSVVEFSYRYENEDEAYSSGVSGRALEVFKVLQTLVDWVDSSSKTKTGYVYSLTLCGG